MSTQRPTTITFQVTASKGEDDNYPKKQKLFKIKHRQISNFSVLLFSRMSGINFSKEKKNPKIWAREETVLHKFINFQSEPCNMNSLINNNFLKSYEEALYPSLDKKKYPFISFFTSISASIKKANPNFL